MPFLDCLNHHFRARGFQHSQGEAGGAIYSYMDRPVEGSGECFARYRLLDCHSAFVGYGFLDSSAPFVMSQAGNVVLADGLQLDVRRNASRGFQGTLPKGSRDLALFMPHVLNKGTDRLELSRLLIPGANAPRALRRVLGLLISRKRPEWTPSRVEGAVLDAEDQILAMSNSFFDAVATKVSEARQRSEADDPPGRNTTLCTVDELVRCQKRHLDAYKDRVEAA
jgi:hypothetical protein